MNSLDNKQIQRIKNYFQRKEKILTENHTRYAIIPEFNKKKLESITIKIVKQINYFGWHTYFDTYHYTCATAMLRSEHVPSNPYKEMQEKYILSLIEELMDTVYYISNNPE